MKCKSILIVEDDLDIQSAIKEALDYAGYKIVHIANNGQEAIEQLKVIEKPCVILLDIMMPVMDGWEFLKIVKETHVDNKIATIPVVIVSAAYDAKKIAKEKGAEGFVKKPIQLTELYNTVGNFCD